MSMERVRHCDITIVVDEDEGDGRTRAVAKMDWRGRKLVGVGRTRPYEVLPDGGRPCVILARRHLRWS